MYTYTPTTRFLVLNTPNQQATTPKPQESQSQSQSFLPLSPVTHGRDQALDNNNNNNIDDNSPVTYTPNNAFLTLLPVQSGRAQPQPQSQPQRSRSGSVSSAASSISDSSSSRSTGISPSAAAGAGGQFLYLGY